jgi:hypothetical protein
MRIAYIAPYQGAAVVKQRPIVRNLSLAARVKIERLAELLQEQSHEVEVLSQGEVVEQKAKIYSGFRESRSFNDKISVYYASTFPVRFINGLYSSLAMLQLFRRRHRTAPFDILLIYNLKPPQVVCAEYAMRRLGLPVILEYEDDIFLNRAGERDSRLTASFFLSAAQRLLQSISGCFAVSSHLLSQTPPSIPQLVLRGIVGKEIIAAFKNANGRRNNWVAFSGTLGRTYGLSKLVAAWRTLDFPAWELHIAGDGEMMPALRQAAEGAKNIVLHGLLDREQNARLLCASRIAVNPHDLTQTSGNIFAFKIMEYLAAGNHLVTTPMGSLDRRLESGITYMEDNTPATIAATLRRVIEDRIYERTAAQTAIEACGPEAASRSIEELIRRAVNNRNSA